MPGLVIWCRPIKTSITQILAASSCSNRTQAALITLRLHHAIKVDDVIGRRRGISDVSISTDELLTVEFLNKRYLHSRLGQLDRDEVSALAEIGLKGSKTPAFER